MHREYRPEQMRLGVPSQPDGSDHGHGEGQAHEHAGEPARDPEVERRVLLATTVVVGALLFADLGLAAIGSPLAALRSACPWP